MVRQGGRGGATGLILEYVVGMPSTELSLRQQFVTIEWGNRKLGVPLSQLEPVEASSTTEEAIADWH